MGQEVPLSCNIVISLYSVDGLAYCELYHKADTALCQAKRTKGTGPVLGAVLT